MQYIKHEHYETMDYSIQNTPNLYLLFICGLKRPEFNISDICYNYNPDTVTYTYVALSDIDHKRTQYEAKYGKFDMGTAILFKNGKVVQVIRNIDPDEIRAAIDKNL